MVVSVEGKTPSVAIPDDKLSDLLIKIRLCSKLMNSGISDDNITGISSFGNNTGDGSTEMSATESLLSQSNNLLLNLCKYWTDMAQASSIYRQVDLLNDIANDSYTIYVLVNQKKLSANLIESVDTIVNSTISLLLDISVPQLYNSRLRKHFFSVIKRFNSIDDSSLGNTVTLCTYNRFFSVVRQHFCNIIEKIKQFCQKNHKLITSNIQSLSCSPLSCCECLSIFFEEPLLYDELIWDNSKGINESPSFIIITFFIRIIQNEAIVRCQGIEGWTPDIELNTCIGNSNIERLPDHDFIVVIKTLTLFLIQGISKHSTIFMELWQNKHNNISLMMQLYKSLLYILCDDSCPREIITMTGHLVAAIVTSVADSATLPFLLFINQLIIDDHTYLEIKHDHLTQLLIYLKKWWIIQISNIPKLSILRGILSQLPQSNPIPVGPQLLIIYDYFVLYVGKDNPVEQLYALQGLSVWISCVKKWIELNMITVNELNRILDELIDTCMKYWDSSFKPLSIQAYKLWDQVLLNLTDQRSNIAECICNKICLNRVEKYQFLALERLTKKLGFIWLLKQQPFILDYILYSIASRPTRNSALQLLLSIMRQCLDEFKPSSSVSIPSSTNIQQNHCVFVSFLFTKIASGLLGYINQCQLNHMLDHTNENHTTGSVILKNCLPKNVIYCQELANEMSEFFIPAFGKRFPHLLAFIWETIHTEKQQSHFLCPNGWTSAEAAILSTASIYGQLKWCNDAQSELLSNSSYLQLKGSDLTYNDIVIHIQVSNIEMGLVYNDDAIRLQIISAICISNETTKLPNTSEWKLIHLIVATGLGNSSPEGRAKVVSFIKKFLSRAIHSFKQLNKKEFLELNTNQIFMLSELEKLHYSLIYYIHPIVPFDMTSPALDILVYLYQLVQTITNGVTQRKLDIFPFMYSMKIWDILLPCMLTGWDKQRETLRSILKLFILPSHHISPLIQQIVPLFNSPRQSDYCGAASILLLLYSIISETDLQYIPTFLDTLSKQFQTKIPIHLISTNDPPYNELTLEVYNSISILTYVLFGLIESIRLFTNEIMSRLTNHLTTLDHNNDHLQTTHGLLCFISYSIKEFPSFSDIFSRLDTVCKSTDPILSAKIHSHILTHLWTCITDIIHCQWCCTQHVLTILSDGVDSVLVSPELYTGSKQLLGQTTRKLCDDNDYIIQKPSRILGVDCRGHPIIKESTNHIEEDLMLLTSWVTIKEGADCITRLMEWIDLNMIFDIQNKKCAESIMTLLVPSFFEMLYYRLVTVLLGIKHPAGMDRLSAAIFSLSRRMASTRDIRYRLLPERWLDKLCCLIKGYHHGSQENQILSLDQTHENTDALFIPLPPPLRRSFSLGHSFLSIITSDPSHYQTMQLLPRSMLCLLKLLPSEINQIISNEQDACMIEVHCLNIFRFLIQCGSLTTSCSIYLGQLLGAAMTYICHPKWTVRNAANLLFSSITQRLIGSYVSTAGEECPKESSSFLMRSLHGNITKSKGEFLCNGAVLRDNQENKLKCLIDILQTYPPLQKLFVSILNSYQTIELRDPIQESAVVCILLFLSKFNLEGCNDIIYCISSSQFNSTCYNARVLASRALIGTYLRFSRCQKISLIAMLSNALKEWRLKCTKESSGTSLIFKNNSFHGLLTFFLEIVSRPSICHFILNDFLFGNSDQVSLFNEWVNDLIRLMSEQNQLICPINKAIILQLFQQLIIGAHSELNDETHTQHFHLGMTRLENFLKLIFPIGYYELPINLQYRISHSCQITSHIDQPINYPIKLPGDSILTVTTARFILLTNVRQVIPILIECLTLHTDEVNHPKYIMHQDGTVLYSLISELLRVGCVLFQSFHSSNKTQQRSVTDTYFFNDEISLDHFQMKCKLLATRLIKCIGYFYNLITQSVSMNNTDNSLFYFKISYFGTIQLMMRAMTLLTSCIQQLNIDAHDIINISFQTIDLYLQHLYNHFPNNPYILRKTIKLYSLCIHATQTKPLSQTDLLYDHFGTLFTQLCIPSNDYPLRHAALNALHRIGLPHPSLSPSVFSCWTGITYLLMDEVPEIQTSAAMIVSTTLHQFSIQDCRQIHSPMVNCQERLQHIRLKKICLLPSVCLLWCSQIILSLFSPKQTAIWIQQLFTGHYPSFLSIKSNLNDIVLMNTVDHTIVKLQTLLFNEEPANMFHQDCFFLTILVVCYINQPKERQYLTQLITTHDVTYINNQIKLCQKLFQDPSSQTLLQHPTYSSFISPTIYLILLYLMLLFDQVHEDCQYAFSELIQIVESSALIHPFFKHSIDHLSKEFHSDTKDGTFLQHIVFQDPHLNSLLL